MVRPDEGSLAAAAQVLNSAQRVTIMAGAGCAGAHDQFLALAGALEAPVLHSLRGKEFVEYDNPYDVGMTGLIGFSSGYRAMEHCDALVLLGSDFPYRPFYPHGVPVVQVDVRGEQIGRRVPVDVPLVGTVADTVDASAPLPGRPGPLGRRPGIRAAWMRVWLGLRSLWRLACAIRRKVSTLPTREAVRGGRAARKRLRCPRRRRDGRSGPWPGSSRRTPRSAGRARPPGG